MFTGIVQALGRVSGRGPHSLEVKAALGRLRPGESVSVNGACLTLNRPPRRGKLSFDLSGETWSRTNLGSLRNGMPVNLEPALKAGEPLGGHLVSGHVDACAKVLGLSSLPGGCACLRVALPGSLRGLVALKGSIAVDGVSLTVTSVRPRHFETVLVPHTLKETNLSSLGPGQEVNLEADLIARYLQALLASGKLGKRHSSP